MTWRLLKLCGVLLAAGSPAIAPQLHAETVLRVMMGADLRGLMPGISSATATGQTLQHIYEGLVAWRSDGTVAPMLADKIDVSADGLAYTFTLRGGVHFSNGAPLTAREVVWTWQQFLDPKWAWPCRAGFDGTRQIKVVSVEALDDLRVVFHLARPTGALLTMMARSDCDSTAIAHPDSVDAAGIWSRAIGTGPYKLAEWRKGQSVELARFDGYASRTEKTDGLTGAKQAILDKIRFLIIPDLAAATLAIQSGNIDVFPELDPNLAKQFDGSKTIKIVSGSNAGTSAILMQPRDPVLRDVRVRRAIVAAIDGPAMRDALTAGFSTVGGSLITPTSAYYGPAERVGDKYDPALAKRLLAAAGYKGEKLTITSDTQFAGVHDAAILAQAMLQAVGINAVVEDVEFANHMDRYYKGTYQLNIWQTTPYLDPMLVFDRFIGDLTKEPEKIWGDPKAMDLLSQLFDASTQERRQSLYDALQGLYVEDAPMLVWAARTSVVALRTTVQGYEPWPGLKPRFWNVWLTQ
jgi:peptide/nickel transport system substrate-binding protein